jgi:hypothetical protein
VSAGRHQIPCARSHSGKTLMCSQRPGRLGGCGLEVTLRRFQIGFAKGKRCAIEAGFDQFRRQSDREVESASRRLDSVGTGKFGPIGSPYAGCIGAAGSGKARGRQTVHCAVECPAFRNPASQYSGGCLQPGGRRQIRSRRECSNFGSRGGKGV